MVHVFPTNPSGHWQTAVFHELIHVPPLSQGFLRQKFLFWLHPAWVFLSRMGLPRLSASWLTNTFRMQPTKLLPWIGSLSGLKGSPPRSKGDAKSIDLYKNKSSGLSVAHYVFLEIVKKNVNNNIYKHLQNCHIERTKQLCQWQINRTSIGPLPRASGLQGGTCFAVPCVVSCREERWAERNKDFITFNLITEKNNNRDILPETIVLLYGIVVHVNAVI